jgi:hypothetical protein
LEPFAKVRILPPEPGRRALLVGFSRLRRGPQYFPGGRPPGTPRGGTRRWWFCQPRYIRLHLIVGAANAARRLQPASPGPAVFPGGRPPGTPRGGTRRWWFCQPRYIRLHLIVGAALAVWWFLSVALRPLMGGAVNVARWLSAGFAGGRSISRGGEPGPPSLEPPGRRVSLVTGVPSGRDAPRGIDIGTAFLVKRSPGVGTTDIIPLSAGSAYRGVDRGQGSGITAPVASLQ